MAVSRVQVAEIVALTLLGGLPGIAAGLFSSWEAPLRGVAVAVCLGALIGFVGASVDVLLANTARYLAARHTLGGGATAWVMDVPRGRGAQARAILVLTDADLLIAEFGTEQGLRKAAAGLLDGADPQRVLGERVERVPLDSVWVVDKLDAEGRIEIVYHRGRETKHVRVRTPGVDLYADVFAELQQRLGAPVVSVRARPAQLLAGPKFAVLTATLIAATVIAAAYHGAGEGGWNPLEWRGGLEMLVLVFARNLGVGGSWALGGVCVGAAAVWLLARWSDRPMIDSVIVPRETKRLPTVDELRTRGETAIRP